MQTKYDSVACLEKLEPVRNSKTKKDLETNYEAFLEDLNLYHDLGLVDDDRYYLFWYWSLHVRDDVLSKL